MNDKLALSDPGRDLGERLLRSREAKGLTWSIVARLAYARAVVQRHGGTPSVRSELGEGSRFVVSLPIRRYEVE